MVIVHPTKEKTMSEMSYIKRLKLISAYNTMVLDRAEAGWQPYFMTFLFRHIPGQQRARLERMNDEICRFYSILLPYVVKYHSRARYKDVLPLLIAAPDLPVPKMQKSRPSDVNGGLHFHGLLALPPIENCLLGNKLTSHLFRNQEKYIWADRPLRVVDARSMSTPTLADYAMKQIKRGRLNYDDILILPKTSDEVRSKPRILMPSDSQR
jgi:hypothetical protein